MIGRGATVASPTGELYAAIANPHLQTPNTCTDMNSTSSADEEREADKSPVPSPPARLAAQLSTSRTSSVRSRIGKRYQALIPINIAASIEVQSKHGVTGKRKNTEQHVGLAKLKYSAQRARDIDQDSLAQYLTFAHQMRDTLGIITGYRQETETLALELLHQNDYNIVDAACLLYAQHTMDEELEQVALGSSSAIAVSHSISMCNGTEREFTAEALEEGKLKLRAVHAETSVHSEAISTQKAPILDAANHKWLTEFYNCLRELRITAITLDRLETLAKGTDEHALSQTVESRVLSRLLSRIHIWQKKCDRAKCNTVTRDELVALLHAAEDLRLDLPTKLCLSDRINNFDAAIAQLNNCLDKSGRRHEAKVGFEELKSMYDIVEQQKVTFSRKDYVSCILEEAAALRAGIRSLCSQEKISLPPMREMLARIELSPINFDEEIAFLQSKILNAQSWLAKVRKCTSKRRLTRRRGTDTQPNNSSDKLEIEEIRALVDDAPDTETPEIFQMQDLLDCANEWAEKVRKAMDKNPTDVCLAELYELMEEAYSMPVEMEETEHLSAEIQAREWCAEAIEMLDNMKSIELVEALLKKAEAIRAKMPSKRKSRWKPQPERNLRSALATAKRWISEVNEAIGKFSFEELFSTANLSSTDKTSNSVGSASKALSKKKSMSTIEVCIEKSNAVAVDLSFYVNRLQKALSAGIELQKNIRELLHTVDKVREDRKNGTATSCKIALTTATSLLDKAHGLPFQFEEALALERLLTAEKEWATRVISALPLRQSRKIRQSPSHISKEDLESLLQESNSLYFDFQQELQLLVKEIDELESWQTKARAAIIDCTNNCHDSLNVLEQLDREAARSLVNNAKVTLPKSPDAKPEVNQETLVKCESYVQPQEEPEYKIQNIVEATENTLAAEPDLDKFMPEIPLRLHWEAILHRIIRESNCSHRISLLAQDECITARPHPQKSLECKPMGPNPKSMSLNEVGKHSEVDEHLKPLLNMAEDDMEAILDLENYDKHCTILQKQSVYKLPIQEGDMQIDESMTSGSDSKNAEVFAADKADQARADDAMKVIQLWTRHLQTMLSECAALSATTAEQQLISLIIEILAWLQQSRAIFHEAHVPLLQLSKQGEHLQEVVIEFQERYQIKSQHFSCKTMEMLFFCLWPLPFLQREARHVQNWTDNVSKFVNGKDLSFAVAKKILENGLYVCRMEPDTLKMLSEEIRKGKSWISKLKKRLKSYLTKHVGRISLSVAQQLVEEGKHVIFQLAAFAFLQDQVIRAKRWEKRLLESKIESGQAQIDFLCELLDEYDRSRWIIDMDMHRKVLQSATERYCICRQPYNGFMIGCDHCDDWFHDTCIGLSKERAEKIEHYTCPSCALLHELSTVMRQSEHIASHVNQESDSELKLQCDKQYKAAMRKLKREEKIAERCEMSLQSCAAQLNQIQARLSQIERSAATQTVDTLSKPQASNVYKPLSGACELLARDNAQEASRLSENESRHVEKDAHGLDCSVSTVPKQENLCIPNVLLSSSKSTLCNSMRQKSSLETNFSCSRKATDCPAQGQPKILPAAMPLTKPEASYLHPGVEQKQVLVPGTTAIAPNAMPHILPQFFQPADSDNTLTNYANATFNSSTSLLLQHPCENIEQTNLRLQLELTKFKAQHADLLGRMQGCRERVLKASKAVQDLAQWQRLRRERAPAVAQWMQNVVLLVLNQVDLITKSILDCAVVASSAESFPIPMAYQQAIVSAEQDGMDHFPQVGNAIRLIREIGWTFVMVSLLQRRPGRNTMVFALQYAAHHRLFGNYKTCMVYSQLRTLIIRMDAWISKVHKCVQTFTSNAAQKLTRLRQAVNEYTKLPLRYDKLVSCLEAFIGHAEHTLGGSMTVKMLASHGDILKIITSTPALGMLGSSPAATNACVNITGARKRKSTSVPSRLGKKKAAPEVIETSADNTQTVVHPTPAKENHGA